MDIWFWKDGVFVKEFVEIPESYSSTPRVIIPETQLRNMEAQFSELRFKEKVHSICNLNISHTNIGCT